MNPVLHIRLLGGPDIRLGDRPVHLETIKTLALLAYLVVRPGPHQRDMLADLLWGEQGPSRAARSLRRALWNIRHVLCPEERTKECPFLIVTRQDVRFNHHSPYTLDIEIFERHISAVEKKKPATSSQKGDTTTIEHLAACVRLYRGDFMEGVYIDDAPGFENWLLGERAYYRERILQALSRLSELHTTRGEYEDAILALRRLLALAPWSEWAHRQLMFCYALAGRRADALAQYEHCRRILKEELAVEPLPETVRLYERIRDPHLFTRTLAKTDQDARHTDSLPPIPFFGRSEEHAWLLARWAQRQGILTLVEGEAGIGKTRLVEEILRHLRGLGVTVLHGRCYQFGSSVPFHPIGEALRHLLRRSSGAFARLAPIWLAELARLLPELLSAHPHLPTPVPLAKSTAARQRLFEAVAQAFLALNEEGLAFFLDDAHWADADTVDMLRYLINRLAEENIWFVIAYRGEELAPGHPFRLLRRDLGQARRLQTLRLHPLSEESVLRTLGEWLALPQAQVRLLGTYLYTRSRGNPFILIEHLRDLAERGILRQTPQGWDVDPTWLQNVMDDSPMLTRHRPATIPTPVQDMILARVERLPPYARELLDVAAVLGEPFSRDLLRAVADAPIRQVDEVLTTWFSRGLVHPVPEEPTPHYNFTHPLIRQVVYQHLPPATRQALHARVGHALETLFAGREEEVIESLAYHFAASPEREKAVHYLLAAGEIVQSRQAQEAAIDFYTQALEIIPKEDPETRYRALSGRERAYNQLARRDAQAQDLTVLWTLATTLADPARQAEVLLRRAEWAMRTTQLQAGIADAQAAQRLAREAGDIGLVVDALRIESMCHIRVGDFERGHARCGQGLRLSQEIGDRRREVLCLGTLGIIDLDRNRLEDARRHMEAALAYWRELGDLWHWAIACNNLSMLYHRLGDYGRALALQEEARDLIPRTGDLGLEAHSYASQGLLYYTIGRYQEALESYHRSLDLARNIQDRGLESYVHACLGETYLALNQVDEAEDAYRRSLAIEEEMGTRFYRPQIWEGLARCALAQDDVDEGVQRLLQAEAYYENNYYPGHASTLALLAYTYMEQGNLAEAQAWLNRFQDLIAMEEDEPSPEDWWLVIRIRKALGDVDAAEQALRRVHAWLQKTAATLNEADRSIYLTQVPVHQAILSAMETGLR